MATNGLQTVDAVLTPCAQLAGTVYSVSRGFKAGTLAVQLDTPNGMMSLAVPAACASTFQVGMIVALTVRIGG